MVMYQDWYDEGQTRARIYRVDTIDERLAAALGRPARGHIIEEKQVLRHCDWESNASSGSYDKWVTVEIARYELDGKTLIERKELHR